MWDSLNDSEKSNVAGCILAIPVPEAAAAIAAAAGSATAAAAAAVALLQTAFNPPAILPRHGEQAIIPQGRGHEEETKEEQKTEVAGESIDEGTTVRKAWKHK
ncbi:uncharacterized protein EMH_0017580 [Eimeria mitis]|uniref:Uncharacterized protein n=1 Tax=Eimeria mitis TaxID=44415 RepID=U6KKG4_9EIME|nr:uncharacterized protein EMH_0017580 [Eimeria mitis]CDJ35928.1 hypothetical protein EMH_0017580 [Eimeria mitis]